MSKKIQLTIPTPCHENWENMLPADKGRFCQSCSKEVIDFTRMTDSQLVAYFKKPSTGSVCGRFQDYQLDRQIIEPRKKLPWIKYFFQFAIPAFLITPRAYTQGEVTGKVAAVRSNELTGDTVIKRYGKQPVIKKFIQGFVKDEKANPVAYASVQIKGTRIGAAADSAGFFSIEIPITDTVLTLVVSSVGFEFRDILLSPMVNIEQPITVLLTMSSMGEVIIAGRVCSRKGSVVLGGIAKQRTFREVVADTFKMFTPKFSIYPNPASAGSPMTIQNRKLPEDTYSIQLINLSGQLIHAEQQKVSKNQNLKLNTAFVPAGTYFIRLTGRKNGKTYSEKLIIR